MSEVKVIGGEVFSVTDTMQAELDASRGQIASGFKKTGELIANHAKLCTRAFGDTWWTAKGKVGAAVKAERDKFFEMGESHLGWKRNNSYQQWLRVQIAAGRPEAVVQPKLAGAVDVDGKTVAELKTMLNRIRGLDKIDLPQVAPLSAKVYDLLMQAADLVGIDESDLK